MRVLEGLVLAMLVAALGIGVYVMWEEIFPGSKIYRPVSAGLSGPIGHCRSHARHIFYRSAPYGPSRFFPSGLTSFRLRSGQ